MDQGKTERVYWFPTSRSVSTLSEEGTTRLVCIPLILVEASLEVGVTSLMRRIPEAYNWRLTFFTRGYAASNKKGLLQVLTLLLIMMEMVATDPGLGLLLVSLFRTLRTVIPNGGVRVHLAKV